MGQARVPQGQRSVIRRQYRLLRTAAEKTQLEIQALARLDVGRYWKIENGFVIPTPEERPRIARALKVSESDLPSADESTPQAVGR